MATFPGRRWLPLLILFLVGLLMAAGCGGDRVAEPRIRIERAWARPAPGPAADSAIGLGENSRGGGNSAAYFTVINDGGAADTLTGVSTDVADEVSLHRSLTEAGIARMLPVARVGVPAGGRLEFRPGGYHVMLMGVTRDLRVGASVRLELHFRESGVVIVDAGVREAPPR
jgi:copper(I)-binding protein